MIPHERVGSGGETSFSKDNVVCVRCALNGFNPLETVSGPAGSGSISF